MVIATEAQIYSAIVARVMYATSYKTLPYVCIISVNHNSDFCKYISHIQISTVPCVLNVWTELSTARENLTVAFMMPRTGPRASDWTRLLLRTRHCNGKWVEMFQTYCILLMSLHCAEIVAAWQFTANRRFVINFPNKDGFTKRGIHSLQPNLNGRMAHTWGRARVVLWAGHLFYFSHVGLKNTTFNFLF